MEHGSCKYSMYIEWGMESFTMREEVYSCHILFHFLLDRYLYAAIATPVLTIGGEILVMLTSQYAMSTVFTLYVGFLFTSFAVLAFTSTLAFAEGYIGTSNLSYIPTFPHCFLPIQRFFTSVRHLWLVSQHSITS